MERAGRTTAMTVISTVPWWWALWLHLFWALAGLGRRLRVGRRKKGQRLLSVASVVFAHWSLLERIPPGRPRRASRRFPHRWSYLVFISNFNGTRDLYLEVFSVAILWKMRALWRGGYGIPDPLPISRFQEYAREQDIPAAHYYCAYPDASTKIIGAALELRDRFQAFAPAAATLEPERFEVEYGQFLREVQGSL
jgi:hypothetical protein